MLTSTEILHIRKLMHKCNSVREVSRKTGFSRQAIRKYLSPDTAVLNGPSAGRPVGQQRLFLQRHHEAMKEIFFHCSCCTPVVAREIEKQWDVKIDHWLLNRYFKEERFEYRRSRYAIATRFETQPGAQMQIDFGECDVVVSGETLRVHFIVAILAYSRRIFVKAFERETQDAWLNGIESAFQYFNGLPKEIVSDNASSLVSDHYASNGVQFTERYQGFCDHYGVKPIATAVRKPRSKGKVERAVRYVKQNALVNVFFDSIGQLNQWLVQWAKEIADKRAIAAQGNQTPEKLCLIEQPLLKPIYMAPIVPEIRGQRRVSKDGLIRVDNKYFRIPDQYASREVQFCSTDTKISVFFAGKLIIELNKATDAYCPRTQPLSTVNRAEYTKEALEATINDPLRIAYLREKASCERPTNAYDILFGIEHACGVQA